MNLFKKLSKTSAESKRLMAIRIIGWGLPVALIPGLRFTQDNDKKPSLRKELFVRDFTAYSVGTGIYFAALTGAKKAINAPLAKNLSKNKKMILPEVASTTSFCLWSGLIAPKISKKFNNSVKPSSKSVSEVEDKSIEKKNVNFSHRLKTPYNTSVYSSFKI